MTATFLLPKGVLIRVIGVIGGLVGAQFRLAAVQNPLRRRTGQRGRRAIMQSLSAVD
jgi:hypothetical protein